MHETELRDLFRRVESFQIDEGSASLSFARRLARENGWSLDYTERVVREYKRFAILAVAAGHPVTPSEDVDQAWHLHLTYTRSYWEGFCRDALQRPLHHNPTEGGASEHAKFFEWYANTLTSYRRIFGQRPPSDVWPAPTGRFARAGAGRWIDPAQYWVIPKLRIRPRSGRLFFFLALLMLVIVLGCGPQGVRKLNPFDFTGIEFLVFYIALLVLGVVASVWCHRSLPQSAEESEFTDDLAQDPYTTAALATGPRGVVLTAIATLFAKGHLQLLEKSEKSFFGSKRRQWLVRGEPLAQNASEIERVLFAAADEEGDVKPQQIVDAGLPIGETYRDRLRESGLVETKPPQDIGHRVIPTCIMLCVLLIGVIKLVVGLSRDKPVGFLTLLLIVTVGFATFFLLSKRYLTPSGRQLLRRLQSQHAQLRESELASGQPPVPDIALTTALFGAGTWRKHEGGLAELHGMMDSQQVLGGAGDPGGAGCGGGGCGGGGCGGGGCGGCGG